MTRRRSGPCPPLALAEAVEARLLLSVDRLDTTFDGDGKLTASFHVTTSLDDVASEILVQADGKVVAAGGPHRAGAKVTRVLRYLPDGAPDNTFSDGGRLTTEAIAWPEAVLEAPGGKLIVAGAGLDDQPAVARFNPDGSPDATFDGDGVATFRLPVPLARLMDARLLADGKIVVTGAANPATAGWNRSDIYLARLNPDGSLDATFGDPASGMPGVTIADLGGGEGVQALEVLDDGSLLVAGQSQERGWFVARFTPGGRLDRSFGEAGAGYASFPGTAAAYVTSLVLQSGRPVLGGYAFGGDKQGALARFNPDGSLDPTFDEDGTVLLPSGRESGQLDSIEGLAVDSSGNLLAAGPLQAAPNPGLVQLVAGVVRFRPDGTRDTTFGENGAATVRLGGGLSGAYAITLDGSGRIVIGGATSDPMRMDWSSDTGVARFTPDGRLDPTWGGDGEVTADFVRRVEARSSYARAAAVQPDGRLLVAGALAYDGQSQHLAIARFMPDGSRDLSFGDAGEVNIRAGTDVSVSEVVGVHLLPDDKILLVVNSNSRDRTLLIRLLPDGTPDTTFGPGGRRGVRISPDQGSQFVTRSALAPDGSILIGGTMAFMDPPASPWFAFVVKVRSDGTVDSSFGDGGVIIWRETRGQSQVNELIALPNGGALVAIDDAWGSVRGILRRLLPNGDPDPSFGADGDAEVGDPVERAELLADGRIVTAGTLRDNTRDIALRRFNPDGTPDASFGAGGRSVINLGPAEEVGDLLAEPDGGVLVGGTGATTGPNDDFFIANVTPSGQLDSTAGDGGVVRTGMPAPATLNALVRQPDGKVVAVGRAASQVGVARYVDASPQVAEAFISSSAWSPDFRTALPNDDGHAIAGGGAAAAADDRATLPWRGLDRITVRFDRVAAVGAADLRVVGPDRSATQAAHFVYNAPARTATWTLPQHIRGDVRVELVLPSGATWACDLRVLPGDVDRNDAVNALDVAEVKRRLSTSAAAGAGYSAFADVTGDGRINALDLAAVKASLTVRPPAPQSGAPAGPLRSSVTRELFGDAAVPG